VNPRILYQNNATVYPSYINYCPKRRRFVANLLYSSTNQQLFKRTKVATIKITDDFCYEWKPSHAYLKIYTFRGKQILMGHKGGHWYVSP